MTKYPSGPHDTSVYLCRRGKRSYNLSYCMPAGLVFVGHRSLVSCVEARIVGSRPGWNNTQGLKITEKIILQSLKFAL